MNERLYDALEVCLNALETGVDIESVLKLYPQEADELRPVLEASVRARALALPAVPEDAVQRGRARVLQHANEMRKAAPRARKRRSVSLFPRLATSLAIALLFLLSGTGLVSASDGALPGDRLYPVKRSWEGLRLFFVFSPEEREGLQSVFEQERLDEISELLTEGRNETIAFAGLVTAQNSMELKVSGITVMIDSSTHLPPDPVSIGVPVIVIGHTNVQGFVEADSLEILSPGVSLPPLEPSQMEALEAEEFENHVGEQQDPGTGRPEQLGNLTYEFKGVVESMSGNLWMINGQQVNVEFAERSSQVSVGALVEFEGFYSTGGQFIVTKIEVKSNGLPKKDQLNSSGKGSGVEDNGEDRSGSDKGSNGEDESNNDHNESSGDHHEDDSKE